MSSGSAMPVSQYTIDNERSSNNSKVKNSHNEITEEIPLPNNRDSSSANVNVTSEHETRNS